MHYQNFFSIGHRYSILLKKNISHLPNPNPAEQDQKQSYQLAFGHFKKKVLTDNL